jgi:2-polyprenyl-6-methoxyphenol hydroxylase-like FAD-dependent oxidoreductase
VNTVSRVTTCCIVGGGPAGIMLGYLLARQKIQVIVLEKHRDFNRDFRGDTVHPSTLDVLGELGILDEFLRLPHQKVESVGGLVGDFSFSGPDFRTLKTRCRFIALIPQWDFLNFLAGKARGLAGFELLMEHEATSLVTKGKQVVGVSVTSREGASEITADLVIACDGRHSKMRKAAGLELQEFGVPIDVLWFRISRHETDPEQLLGNVNYGRVLILINRGDYLQAGLLIKKGSFEDIKKAGLPSFRNRIERMAPYLADRTPEIQHWDQVKLLSVQINRLRTWYRPGFVCIGDAAHAMSPAGGVGINLAIQDAVAAAKLLSEPLLTRSTTEQTLSQVQRRRQWPTRVTQALQVNAHRGFAKVFQSEEELRAPWQLKLISRFPGLPWLLARIVGVGVRPEHIHDSAPRGRARPSWVSLGAGAAAVSALGVACIVRSRR